jgi:tRNA threonylcarbamoyladenosine biosynthesis protein TsaB
MRILALETSDKTGSVAAIADGNLLAELMLDRKQRSAQSLAPAMQLLLHEVGWQPSDVQLVAVSIGPGSFTGLRVGVTAAKVFAYSVGAEVLGISTLEAIAGNCPALPSARVSVVIDAQRGEVVVQSFVRQTDGWFEPAGPEELLDADTWLARLQTVGSRHGEPSNPQSPIPNPPVVTGPGLARLLDRLPSGAVALDEALWHPRAAVVGRLAVRYRDQGRRDDLWKLVPRYYRRSAAEEKWDARMAQT